MSDSRKGYFGDLPYVPLHIRELSPLFINFSLLKAGYKPPKSSELSYCELGCGYGYNLVILAACYPEIDFVGVDFNSEHIANAQDLVETAELKNIKFYDISFDQFAKLDIPKFDYITMHGVWSWVTPEVQNQILSILSEKLKNRGALYLSYNSMPGCAVHSPLKKLYYDLYNHADGSVPERIGKTVQMVDTLIQRDIAYFKHSPLSKARHHALKETPPSYFAHEYLGEAWGTFFISDVCKELQKVNLDYAGSALLNDTKFSVEFDKEYKDVLKSMPDPIFHEQLKDYVRNTHFRKDIFVRGKLEYGPSDWMQEIGTLRVGIYGTHNNFPHKFELHGEQIDLPIEAHTLLIETLKKTPNTLGELRSLSVFSQMEHWEFFHIVCCCIEAGQISLLRYSEDISIYSPEAALRLNKVLLEHAARDGKYQFLAAPEFGCGISCSQIDQIFLQALHNGQDPAQEAIKAMNGETLMKHGKPVHDQDEALKLLQEAAEEFRAVKLEYFERFAIAA